MLQALPTYSSSTGFLFGHHSGDFVCTSERNNGNDRPGPSLERRKSSIRLSHRRHHGFASLRGRFCRFRKLWITSELINYCSTILIVGLGGFADSGWHQ